MSKLYFKIGADYDKVIRLRNEIAKLKQELLSMNQAANPQEFARLERQLRQTSQEFENLVRQAALAATHMQNTTVNINHTTSSLGGMNSMLAKIGGTVALSKLASDIVRIRGEFQAADTAIQTLLGSKEKADALMKQVREYAKISPLEFSDVTAATQMMLGFNIEAEKVPGFIKAIGDVSMGESQKFNSLTLAFSQMSATGKLMGQDLNQMINAGFNPLQQIALTTGKSIAILKEEMSKGAITTEMVQQAFVDATSAGGKFYQMSENASKTINGQLSMLQDAMDAAFNEMGEKSEDIIMSGIQVSTSLIQNYETIGKVLVRMIATYGVYRTALITNIALTRGWAVAARADAVAKGLQTMATKAQTIAQLALNSAMKANPYVLAATLIVGVATAMWAFHDSTTAAEKAQKRFNAQKEATIKKERDHKQKLEELISTIQNEYTSSLDRVRAMDAIKDNYPSLFQKYIDEKGHIRDLIGLWNEYNEEASKGRVKENKNNYTGSKTLISEYQKVIDLWKKFGEDPNFHKSSLTDDEKALVNKYKNETLSTLKSKLEEENKILLEYQKEVRADELAQWQLDLKKKTDIQIKSELDEMKRIQQARKNNPRYSLNVGVGSLKGATTESEMQQRIAILESEYKIKSEGNSSYKEAFELAKKEWIAAKKALEESKKKSKDDYDKAKKELAAKEKAYKDLGGVTDKGLKKQESEAEKQRNAQEKYKLLLDKQGREQARLKIDSLHELEQIEINGLEEGSEKVLRQRKLNHEKELEQIKREAEDKKLKEIEKAQTAFQANPENKGKAFDVDKFVKSEPAKKQFAVFDKVAETKTKNADTKYNRGDDLKGLLNEYQDYTDKRLAIERKFNEDIAVLQEQRKQAVKSGDTPQVEQIDRSIAQATRDKGMGLMSLDYDKLKESPEYVRAFENLKETSSETLNSLLSQLENAKQTAAKVLSPDQLREYTTTIQEIMDELDSRNPFQALSDKKQELAEAEEELANAQIELENARTQAEAVKGGAKIENGVKSSKFNEKTGKIDSTKAYLTEAQALDKVKDKTAAYNSAKDKVVKKSAKVKKAEKDVTKQIDELSKAVSDVGAAIGGPAGEIISLIGDIGSFTMMAMDGVKAAADTSANAISTVEKASVILAIISAAVQIATKIFDMFGKDTTTENYEKAKEAYESYINILDRVIEKQLELAESLSGENANAAYQKALDTIKEQSSNARVLGKQYLDSGASRKSHSKGYDEVRDMSWEGWNQAANALGMSIDNFKNKMGGRMTGLFDLTDEQLVKLQEDAGIFWSQLDSDTQNYADQIVNGVAKIAEVMEQRMTDTTLIDVVTLRSDFQDLLTDMDADSASFAGNFEEYMRNAILNSMLKQDYMERLKKWREKFYAAMDNGVTEEEYNALKDEGQQIADEMKNRRDEMADMFGWTGENSSQFSTQKGFQAMSQETGEELNGRFTALQIAGEEIKNQSIIQTGLLSSINEKMTLLDLSNEDIPQLAASSPNIAGQTREIITNSYQPQVNVVFPDAKLDVLTGEVSTMKNIVNEMRTLQVEGNLDTQEIREGIQIISKNSPRVLANMDEMKRDIKNVL